MPRARPVIQTDVNGNLIKEFPSPEVAIRELKIKSGLIAKSLAGVRRVVLGKWKFSYKRDEASQPQVPQPHEETTSTVEPKKVDPESEDEEDKWLTPFERVLKRRKK